VCFSSSGSQHTSSGIAFDFNGSYEPETILLADKHLAIQDIRPICCKHNWFAELVQSGRMHITSCWNYLRFHKSSYPASMNILRSDLQWWIALLSEWEKDTSTPLVYKILSADSLARDPHSMYIVQSDASGVDGFGYFHSYLNDSEVHYVSKRWDGSLEDPCNSMCFELRLPDTACGKFSIIGA